MPKQPTKERILEAALTLFAEKGYDGVGVDLIAETAGLKGPSLYKHFHGKEDILASLIASVELYYNENIGARRNSGQVPTCAEELAAISLGQLQFTMHDPTIRKIRRVLAMEQFRNPRIAALTTLHHMEAIWDMYTGIFAEMQEQGYLKKGDPRQMAMSFSSPLTLLLHTYDRQPEREAEIIERMEQYVRTAAADLLSEGQSPC